jgi:hypothetical protein
MWTNGLTMFLGMVLAAMVSGRAGGAALEVRLVAHKESYVLDLGGKSAEQFRKQILDFEKKGRDLPQPPAVDLVLELRNTSDKDLHVCLGQGDYGLIHGLTLELKGPGALKASFANARGAQVPPTIVDVPAGKTHKVVLTRLETSDGRTYRAVYWTQPGEYTLVLRCDLVARAQGAWQTVSKLESNPVKLKVVEKK